MSDPLVVDQFADQIRNVFRWAGHILKEMKKER